PSAAGDDAVANQHRPALEAGGRDELRALEGRAGAGRHACGDDENSDDRERTRSVLAHHSPQNCLPPTPGPLLLPRSGATDNPSNGRTVLGWLYPSPVNPQRRTALVSVLAAAALVTLKLVVGLVAHSLGLVSEAAHSGTDLVSALLTFFAVGVAVRPADP